MNVITHQAIRIDLALELFFPLHQNIKIKTVIIGIGKNYLTIMTPLNNMMRLLSYDYS